MKKLENYGVQTLSEKEVMNTEGGIFGVIVGVLVGAAATEVFGDWEHFKQGLTGNY